MEFTRIKDLNPPKPPFSLAIKNIKRDLEKLQKEVRVLTRTWK